MSFIKIILTPGQKALLEKIVADRRCKNAMCKQCPIEAFCENGDFVDSPNFARIFLDAAK